MPLKSRRRLWKEEKPEPIIAMLEFRSVERLWPIFRCVDGSSEVRTLSWIIGMLAVGFTRVIGTKTPWSQPVCFVSLWFGFGVVV